MTLQELAQHDGRNGRKAYIAVNNKIYDVTHSPLWSGGDHQGAHQAGCDLTEVLSQAPHGEDKVQALPKVGSLRSGDTAGMTPPQKLFYGMAYMNLGIVLLIILILACWKWW